MATLFEDRSLRNKTFIFKDRAEAGKRLAQKLSKFVSPEALVLAIPAGGVPVACEISRVLKLPLDLMIVRKIQIPGQTEAGFGAVGPDGETIFNEELLRRLRLRGEVIQQKVEETKKVVEARNQFFRDGRPFPPVKGKTVILVDDGLASGFTMMEAVRFMRRREAEKVIVAIPTAPEDSVNRLLPEADEIFCLNVRTFFPFAVADAYENWYDLTDQEVISLLKDLPSHSLFGEKAPPEKAPG
jgi:predicted phosphoribosyltransferase